MEGSQDDPLAMSRWVIRQKLHDLFLIAIHQPTLAIRFFWGWIRGVVLTRHGVESG